MLTGALQVTIKQGADPLEYLITKEKKDIVWSHHKFQQSFHRHYVRYQLRQKKTYSKEGNVLTTSLCGLEGHSQRPRYWNLAEVYRGSWSAANHCSNLTTTSGNRTEDDTKLLNNITHECAFCV